MTDEYFTTSITLKKDTSVVTSRRGIVLSKLAIDIIEKCDVIEENNKLVMKKTNIRFPVRLKKKINKLKNLSRTIDDGLAIRLLAIDEHKKEEHQGWKNWETWNVNLWLTNDYETYQEVCDLVSQFRNDLYGLHKTLAEFWDDLVEKRVVKDQISKHRIDWKEICNSLSGGE